MLSSSSCHSCVWIQASPLNFTNVAASTVQLALSLSRAPHTQRIYLYEIDLKLTKIQKNQKKPAILQPVKNKLHWHLLYHLFFKKIARMGLFTLGAKVKRSKSKKNRSENKRQTSKKILLSLLLSLRVNGPLTEKVRTQKVPGYYGY